MSPKYPSPPSNIGLNPDVELMHKQYMRWSQGREKMSAMAYFCLTILEWNADGNRQKAASKYLIEKRVLDKIGDLTANKGGSEARKAAGTSTPLSSQEHCFLQRAVQALIRRMAEKQHSPEGQLPVIALTDLPSLENDPDAESNTST